MNNNYLLLLLAFMFLIPATTASTVTPQNPTNITLQPNEEIIFKYDIGLHPNDTEVAVTPTDTGDYTLSYRSFRRFTSNGTLKLEIEAPDAGNYTHNITLSFKTTTKQGNQTSTTTDQHDIRAKTLIPYTTLIQPTWINASNYLTIDNTKYQVSDIASNLYFNNNSIKVTGTKTLNDARVHLLGTIPGEYAKIKVDTKSDSTTAAIKTKEVEKEEPCKLDISTEGGTVLRRGRLFVFKTVNANNGERIGGVNYQLRKTTSPGGIISSGTTSNTFATAQVSIPETLYKDNPDVETVTLQIVKEGSGCTPTTKTVKIGTAYGEYIQENDEFQLVLTPFNDTVYTPVNGTVTAKEGDVDTGLVKITKPNGDTTDVAFNTSGFTYNPSTSGTYKFTATKDGYVSSDTVKVEYVADKDGDGVPNTDDDCPEEEGVEANNGCEKQRVEFAFDNLEEGHPLREPAQTSTRYGVTLFDSDGNTINYSDDVPVTRISDSQEKDMTVPFENGTAPITFQSEADYEFNFTGTPRYKPETETITAKSPAFISWKGIGIIAGILAVIGIGFVVASGSGGSSSRSRGPREGTVSFNAIGDDEQ